MFFYGVVTCIFGTSPEAQVKHAEILLFAELAFIRSKASTEMIHSSSSHYVTNRF